MVVAVGVPQKPPDNWRSGREGELERKIERGGGEGRVRAGRPVVDLGGL